MHDCRELYKHWSIPADFNDVSSHGLADTSQIYFEIVKNMKEQFQELSRLSIKGLISEAAC